MDVCHSCEVTWSNAVPDAALQRGAGEPVPAAAAEGRSMTPPENSELVPCGTSVLPKGEYYIKSIDYPKPYLANYQCMYHLTPQCSKGAIFFHCPKFDITSSDLCVNDFLHVSTAGRFCGQVGPQLLFVPRPPLVLHFRSDSRLVAPTKGTGYLCQLWSMAEGAGPGSLSCGQHVLKPGTYSLLSKNYPANYESLLYCGWELRTQNAADQLSISCPNFKMEPDNKSDCMWDRMMVNERRFCGSNAPTVSAQGSLNVDYGTDAATVYSGFNCTVTVTAAAAGRSD